MSPSSLAAELVLPTADPSVNHDKQEIEVNTLTIAARSIWPAGAACGLTDPTAGLAPPTGGRAAAGTGGLPPGLDEEDDAPGLGPVTGGFGAGLLAMELVVAVEVLHDG
jgi:hypothetical protein